MRKDTQAQLRSLAYDWHGGQTSALYSFASTKGTVHTEEHKDNLLAEVLEAIKEASDREARIEVKRLQTLWNLIKEAEIGIPCFPDTH